MRARSNGCGGFASWSGPCGALDCPSCHTQPSPHDYEQHSKCEKCGEDGDGGNEEWFTINDTEDVGYGYGGFEVNCCQCVSCGHKWQEAECHTEY